jgi:hypothetical protein
MRFKSLTSTGGFEMGCIMCKRECEVDEQPKPGRIYECPYCGKFMRITRVFLCLDCNEVHVRGKEYASSTGWEFTK